MSGVVSGAEQGEKKHKKNKSKKAKKTVADTAAGEPSSKKARVEQEKPIEAEGAAVVPVFADAEADDHCETPLEAYEDVAVFLDALCGQLGRTRASLRVYDPYYCVGGVVERLGSLGFASVVNVPQDCYATWNAQQYDVLVTNPPYSGSHIERLVSFLAARRLPFAVLVPNFVVKKP
jgi:hypothetical protein